MRLKFLWRENRTTEYTIEVKIKEFYEGRPKCRINLGELHSSTAGYNSSTIDDITEFQDCSINIRKNATNIFAVWYLNLQ